MTANRFRAAAIRELMARDSLTLSAFVRRSGFSRQLIGGWISGTVQPRFDSVLLLASRFGVDANFFAEGLPDPAPAGALGQKKGKR